MTLRSVRIRPAQFLFVFLLSFSFPAFASGQKEDIYRTKREWVALRPIPSGYPHLAPYNHPALLSTEMLKEILQDVYYRENVVVSLAWGKPHPLFSPSQLDLLADSISKALSRASPDGVAAFAVSDDKHERRRTKGFCFVLGNDLHLVIEELRRPDYLGDDKPYQFEGQRWKLDPRAGQHLFPTRPGNKGKQDNWLVIALPQQGETDAETTESAPRQAPQ